TVAAPEGDRDVELAAAHLQDLRGRIDDLVRSKHREVPGHELHDGAQAVHGRAHGDAREAELGNGRVDHALGAELVQHALAHLVGAVVFRHLLAHEEDVGITAHLLAHCLVQGLTELYGTHGYA